MSPDKFHSPCTFVRRLVLVTACIWTFAGAAGSQGGVASECAVWGGVASIVQQGAHSGADSLCQVNDLCTGVSCSQLSEAANVTAEGVRGATLGFSLEILPCSFPLTMRVVLERSDAPRFSRNVGIQNSGQLKLILPPGGSQLTDVVKELNLLWISTLRPIRFQVDLQLNYTVLSNPTRTLPPRTPLSDFALVPRILVPIPDCHRFGVATTRGLPAVAQTTTPPGGVTGTVKSLSLQPLWVGVGLASFILLVLVAVLIQRLSFAPRPGSSPYKHSRLVDDYSVDSHMIQV